MVPPTTFTSAVVYVQVREMSHHSAPPASNTLRGDNRLHRQRQLSTPISLGAASLQVDTDNVNFGDRRRRKNAYNLCDWLENWWLSVDKAGQFQALADTPWLRTGVPLRVLEMFCLFLVDIHVRPAYLCTTKQIPVMPCVHGTDFCRRQVWFCGK